MSGHCRLLAHAAHTAAALLFVCACCLSVFALPSGTCMLPVWDDVVASQVMAVARDLIQLRYPQSGM